jgi:transposase-like protein
MSASDLCRKHGISDATFYKWRSRYGGMEISDARKLKASRPSSIAAAAPDPTEPKPCSRLLICLQINQQTIASKVVARNAALIGGLHLSLAAGN